LEVNQKTFLRLALSLSLLLGSSACSARLTSVPEISSRFSRLEIETEKQVLDRLVWQAGEILNLATGLSAKAGRSGLSRSLNLNVVAEVPDRVRLEMLAPGVNSSLGVLLLDGDSTSFYDRQNKTFYKGDGKKSGLEAFLGLPLETYELITWLTGKISVSQSSKLSESKVFKDRRGSGYIVEISGLQGKLDRYLIEEKFNDEEFGLGGISELLIRSRESFSNGKLFLKTNYDYRASSKESGIRSRALPSRVSSHLEIQDIDLNLSLKKPALNQLSEKKRRKLFSLKPPKSFKKTDKVNLLWDF